MKIPKPMTLAIILILIGVVFFVLMFFNPISDIALAVAGAGFVLSGFILLAQARSSEQIKKQSEQLLNKLEEIQQEFKKLDQPKNTGVAIADVLGAGIKYYTENIQKRAKDND